MATELQAYYQGHLDLHLYQLLCSLPRSLFSPGATGVC